MKVKSEREVAQLCLTLSDLMDCCLAGSSVSGIFQARVLEWGTVAFSICRVCIRMQMSIMSAVTSHRLGDLDGEQAWTPVAVKRCA